MSDEDASKDFIGPLGTRFESQANGLILLREPRQVAAGVNYPPPSILIIPRGDLIAWAREQEELLPCVAEQRGYRAGIEAAADELEKPYPADVSFFAPLSYEQVVAAVDAMGGDISGRLHAQWARHWADLLRRRTAEKEQP